MRHRVWSGPAAFFVVLCAMGPAQDRNLAVIVEVNPSKSTFHADEPLLCEVLIRNELKHEIRVPAYTRAPNDWNGETAFIRVVDIRRKPTSVVRPGEWRPRVTVPNNIAGNAAYRVKPGDTYRMTINLRKWPLVGGWSPGDYSFNVCVEHLILDSRSTAFVMSEFAQLTIE